MEIAELIIKISISLFNAIALGIVLIIIINTFPSEFYFTFHNPSLLLFMFNVPLCNRLIELLSHGTDKAR